ncbi:MAG TPA: translation initiation factor IF-2, partial [Nitrososphaeraceae archaeon]|nr:translation initiation factor IF-2 [Nitrososphaeraceae archaeon]
VKLRQPILVVLGHVDSGKTSLLDTIRGTGVQGREAGGITQHIGASFFPIDTIKTLTGYLYEKLAKSESPIPGLLVIDTPGHEVFANLRSRGGSAADIAILVADVNKGFEPQTYESMEILKKRRVPFVVALNKIDMIPGWRHSNSQFVTEQVKAQDLSITSMLDEKIYNIVGSLSRLGYNSEGFWRVKDFTKEVAIVPVSAAKNIGVPELLAVVVGLSQQFMSRRLERKDGPGRGIVLEVKEETGLGPSANLVLIEGVLKVGDLILVAKRDKAVTTKVKALLLPKPLDEMRDPRDKFKPVSEVMSAAGIKVTSPDLEGVLAGSPLYVLDDKDQEPSLRSIVEDEIRNAIVTDTNTNGIILRCDTIGSLEAIRDMLKKANVPIQKADIGHITRRDILAASAVKEKNRYLGVVLGFNTKILDEAKREAQERTIPIFSENIIYNLVRSYTEWVEYQKEHEDSILFNEIPPICKFQFMKGFVFRRNYPAVFGAEIQIGKLRQKVNVLNEDGKKIGTIHQIQENGKPIEEAGKGEQVAVSIKEISVGRQVNEGDIFYTDLGSKDARLLLERFYYRLAQEEKDILNTIVSIKRRNDPSYAYI